MSAPQMALSASSVSRLTSVEGLSWATGVATIDVVAVAQAASASIATPENRLSIPPLHCRKDASPALPGPQMPWALLASGA